MADPKETEKETTVPGEEQNEKRSLSDYIPQKRAADKKKAKTVVIILAVLFVVLLGLNFLASMDLGDKFKGLFGLETDAETKKPHSIIFYTPDYDENIFDDPEYTELNHFVSYTEGAATSMLAPETDFLTYGQGLKLLTDCLYAARDGNDTAYNACFSAAYLEEQGSITEFTMQRIYDIDIKLLTSTVLFENTPEEVHRFEYRVSFRIQKNNGTFRHDFGSDVALPQIYEVIIPDATGIPVINSISDYVR